VRKKEEKKEAPKGESSQKAKAAFRFQGKNFNWGA